MPTPSLIPSLDHHLGMCKLLMDLGVIPTPCRGRWALYVLSRPLGNRFGAGAYSQCLLQIVMRDLMQLPSESIIVWIFLFILIGVILLGVLAAIFGAR